MSHDVFICHSSKDRNIANAICSTLEQHRIRCWIAPRDVLPGSDYAQSIVEGISGSRLTVLVFSAESNRSTHVRREIERTVSHGIPILPFRVDDVVPSPSLEYFISDAHWLDAVTPPIEQHLAHLVGTVQLLLERETVTTGAPAPAARTMAGAALPPPSPVTPTGMPPPSPIVAPPPAIGPTPSRRSGPPLWTWLLLGVVIALAGVAVILAVLGGGDDERTTAPDSTDSAIATLAPSAGDVSGDATDGASDEVSGPASGQVVAPTIPVVTAPVVTAPVVTPVATAPPVSGDLLQAPVDVLDSFVFTQQATFTWDGGSMTLNGSGTYVAPDNQDCTVTVDMSGYAVTVRAIVTGGQAWYDDGAGGGLEPRDAADPELLGTLTGCATSHSMWGEDWMEAPPGGEEVTLDGLQFVSYDVSTMASTWGEMFGLPPGLDAGRMILYTSTDRTWIAGMDTVFAGSADAFRAYMGFPPESVTGDCTMSMTMTIRQPDDPTLAVVAPA